MYCGTESKNKTPTYSTQLLLDSYRKLKPIRVLRKKSKSKFAPKEGIRYDGLYEAVGKELLDEEKAMWRFELRRMKGQDPIRYQGPEARPTLQELEQLKNLKALLH
jgi:SAD/SRA domain-containing protein